MPILRDFERRLGGLVEGFFATTFRSGLQPVELAKRMMREMDASKTVGVKEVWAPNRYVFTLSESDGQRFEQAEQALVGELKQVVREAAAERGWGLVGPPEVEFEVDPDLGKGRFGCEASFVEGEEELAPQPAVGERGSLVRLADGVSTALAKPSDHDRAAPRMRRGRGRRRGLPPARSDPPHRGRVRPDRPGLDERDDGQRRTDPGARPRTRRPHHDRRDRARVPERLSVSPFVLSVLKYSLLVLLYFFVFRAIRSVAVDVGGRKRGATTQMRTPAPASTAKPSKGGRAPTQVVVHDAGGGKPVTVKLRDTVEIGRGDRCAIRLQDTYVSQVHARLYGKDGAWYVEDQGSTNGTLLNDRRVDAPVEVHAGDVLKVGKTVLELKR